MPKVAKITELEIAEADEKASDLTIELHHFANRMEQGYCNPISDPLTFARSFLALSRAAGAMASMMLHKEWMQQQKAELKRIQTETAALQSAEPTP